MYGKLLNCFEIVVDLVQLANVARFPSGFPKYAEMP